MTTAERRCRVFWSALDGVERPGWALLDPAERDRADGYRHGPSRDRFTLGRALARAVVGRVAGVSPGSVRFIAVCRGCGGPHGRLVADTPDGPLWVSVTHSAERVGVALAGGAACGLDLEAVTLRGALPVRALSGRERAALGRLPDAGRVAAFIRLWTRKEAVLKATGDGLAVPPANLTVSPPWRPARLLSWVDRPPPHTAVHLRDLDVGPGYRACLAALDRPAVVTQRHVHLDEILANTREHTRH
jgi:4'-phosphopantetheinyl transferase